MKVLAIGILVAIAILASEADGRLCLRLRDCPCGDVCVNKLNKSCLGYKCCKCKPGCVVFDLFIAPGASRLVYGNSCSCPDSPQASKGMAACTRAGWEGQPARIPPYPENPTCVE